MSSILSKHHRAIVEEAAQVLESAASYNRSMFRTILAHDQQERANRLRSILNQTTKGSSK